MDIFLYSSACVIDGLFVCQDKINLSKFKFKKIYANNNDNYITTDSLIVYEIKSGNPEIKLINQMKQKGNFIYQYLKSIYNKLVYYIWFYRNNAKDNLLHNDKKENNKDNIRELYNKIDKTDIQNEQYQENKKIYCNQNKIKEVNDKKDYNSLNPINQAKIIINENIENEEENRGNINEIKEKEIINREEKKYKGI